MDEKSPAKKAWDTMRNKPPAKKAADTRKRKTGAIKATGKVKIINWQTGKVNYLKALNKKAIPGVCIVCGDNRQYVLHRHHADTEKKTIVILCANCHDTVRRADLGELKEAHK
jgi:hypothetical protein